jgi:hypothetical protein
MIGDKAGDPMNKQTAKKGSLIRVDRGEYSSYQVTGFFVALDCFSPYIELKRYMKAIEGKGPYDPDGFISHLISEGKLLEIDHSTLYLAEYAQEEDCQFSIPLRQA